MDGTIYLDDQLFPYSRSFLQHVVASGREYVFFTNNSSRSHRSYVSKLHGMGIYIPPDKMLLSTQVLLDFLQREKRGKTVWVAGTSELLEEFTSAGINPQSANPDIVIIGFDKSITYEKLVFMHNAIKSGAEFFGVNMDLVCPMPGGDIPDCGSLAKVLTASTGVEPEYFGKPSPRALAYICRRTGLREEELCFVGDRLYTDIAIACNTKASSVLVLSGEAKRSDLLLYPRFIPDLIVEDLSLLVSYI